MIPYHEIVVMVVFSMKSDWDFEVKLLCLNFFGTIFFVTRLFFIISPFSMLGEQKTKLHV